MEHVADGCPGHGPAGFFGLLSWLVGWVRDGVPVLSILAGPIQHFRSAVLEGWRSKVSADLCAGEGFRGCPWLDCSSFFFSDHVRERDKALLRSILVGGVWNGFLLRGVRGRRVPCRFCGGTDRDGHLFGRMSFSTSR